MWKSILSFGLAVIILIFLANYQNLPFGIPVWASVIPPPAPRSRPHPEKPAENPVQPVDTVAPSCADPIPAVQQTCRAVEQQILASTVRLEWHFLEEKGDHRQWEGNTGYATIKDNRYLVTHNHAGISLADPDRRKLTAVSIFSARGKPLYLNVPLANIDLLVEGAETLVLDFGYSRGELLFNSDGLTSAKFEAWELLPLRPGLEVAQIDWDGTEAHVDWVTVRAIRLEEGIPTLVLSNFVNRGASGGGVFWNGTHIANTWFRVTAVGKESRQIRQRYSVAALNSPQLADLSAIVAPTSPPGDAPRPRPDRW